MVLFRQPTNEVLDETFRWLIFVSGRLLVRPGYDDN